MRTRNSNNDAPVVISVLYYLWIGLRKCRVRLIQACRCSCSHLVQLHYAMHDHHNTYRVTGLRDLPSHYYHATYDIIYSDTDSHVTPSTRALIYANSEQRCCTCCKCANSLLQLLWIGLRQRRVIDSFSFTVHKYTQL